MKILKILIMLLFILLIGTSANATISAKIVNECEIGEVEVSLNKVDVGIRMMTSFTGNSNKLIILLMAFFSIILVILLAFVCVSCIKSYYKKKNVKTPKKMIFLAIIMGISGYTAIPFIIIVLIMKNSYHESTNSNKQSEELSGALDKMRKKVTSADDTRTTNYTLSFIRRKSITDQAARRLKLRADALLPQTSPQDAKSAYLLGKLFFDIQAYIDDNYDEFCEKLTDVKDLTWAMDSSLEYLDQAVYELQPDAMLHYVAMVHEKLHAFVAMCDNKYKVSSIKYVIELKQHYIEVGERIIERKLTLFEDEAVIRDCINKYRNDCEELKKYSSGGEKLTDIMSPTELGCEPLYDILPERNPAINEPEPSDPDIALDEIVLPCITFSYVKTITSAAGWLRIDEGNWIQLSEKTGPDMMKISTGEHIIEYVKSKTGNTVANVSEFMTRVQGNQLLSGNGTIEMLNSYNFAVSGGDAKIREGLAGNRKYRVLVKSNTEIHFDINCGLGINKAGTIEH